jgi:hypothetical protein
VDIIISGAVHADFFTVFGYGVAAVFLEGVLKPTFSSRYMSF